jgi:hypothetical protein
MHEDENKAYWIKEGRKQIIKVIKKNYPEFNYAPPSHYRGVSSMTVSFSPRTLESWFKELEE